MKKSLQKKVQQALDVDKQAVARSGMRFRDRAFDSSTHAPRDITGPIAGMAREIDIEHIKPDPNQPRKTINKKSLENLAASIRVHGVLQPITVYRSDEANAFLLLVGQRRLAAAQLAKLKRIPCIIRPDAMDESQRLQQQLVENILPEMPERRVSEIVGQRE